MINHANPGLRQPAKGAQSTGRDERKVRTLSRMIDEHGIGHVLWLLHTAMGRVTTPRCSRSMLDDVLALVGRYR